MKQLRHNRQRSIALAIAWAIMILVINGTQSIHAQTVSTPAATDGFPASSPHTAEDGTKAKTPASMGQHVPPQRESSTLVAPNNDSFSNAENLGSSFGLLTGTNVEATLEPSEPQAANGDRTVWYKWKAPANYSIVFETVSGPSTLTDTVVAIYTGAAVSNLTLVSRNDDINGSHNRLSRVTFIAVAGQTYEIQVRGYGGLAGTFQMSWHINSAIAVGQFNFDYTGIGNLAYLSDFAVFRPSDGRWYIRLSGSGAMMAQNWGTSTDVLYPGDFDGDGNTDIGVWRPSNGTFYALSSLDNSVIGIQWGLAGDVPVQGDFDGDYKADFAVWRPSNGTFYVRRSTDGALVAQPFGQAGDVMACGDYDGDGKTDFGVLRSGGAGSVFYILRSSDATMLSQPFGTSGDQVAPGDYDGDGKNDIAVYRPLTNVFYALRSSNATLFALQWGMAGDIFAPGNYLVDTRTDVTVFRPGTGTFYSYSVASNAPYALQWGTNGDIPIARSNVH